MLQSSTIGLIDQKTYKLILKMKVGAEEINPYNLHIKVEKAIKVARDKKVADDGVLGDVLELLTEWHNNKYAIGEWSKDFIDVTTMALKKNPKATKCTDHRTSSLNAHTSNVAVTIFGRRREMKIENVTGDNFGFGRGNGTMGAIGMLKIASKRTLDIDGKLCVFFINWQKEFDRVNWSKLMQILKEMGIVWREKKK